MGTLLWQVWNLWEVEPDERKWVTGRRVLRFIVCLLFDDREGNGTSCLLLPSLPHPERLYLFYCGPK